MRNGGFKRQRDERCERVKDYEAHAASALDLGSKLGRLLRQYQHLFEFAEIDRGPDIDVEEKPGAFLRNPRDLSDQQAARKNPVHPRGYDRVAGLHVLGAIDVLHRQSAVEQARDDPARTAALIEGVERRSCDR